MNADVVVVGGGLVGASIALGLVKKGLEVLVIDGEDRDFRASNANGGLVWQHTKGLGNPHYQALTRQSVDVWGAFRDELEHLAGIEVPYQQSGGLQLCLGENAFSKRRSDLERLHNQIVGTPSETELLDRPALDRLLPGVRFGKDVTGASYCRRDGFANPLATLAALHIAIVRLGGHIRGGMTVRNVVQNDAGLFLIDYGYETATASKVVLAAGLGSAALGAHLGLAIPISPLRGQILITERVEPFLPVPILGLAQLQEGTVMIGTTHEHAGLDAAVTADAATSMSAEAVRMIPALAMLKVVRQWAGLRVMTPDGYPIYAQSKSHPGAFVATCHSGVTLAAAHATMIADGIAAGAFPNDLAAFTPDRFSKTDLN
ncbi:NAD(P)/FAD-dependent oxidoreductase [Sphingomonas crocodyli]|uniref:FAD-binding oxidoreductase n=1 Tax=Sphingomonas crocodyli TaxID=1979270 RepID=A0A437M747_9SPHN|nr:FAD-dependent oxidoreductase [Sphingomonas crocodyli]RVT93492.1 FAD-binding oxidoreductase [Sphingomonas crocodyli]